MRIQRDLQCIIYESLWWALMGAHQKKFIDRSVRVRCVRIDLQDTYPLTHFGHVLAAHTSRKGVLCKPTITKV